MVQPYQTERYTRCPRAALRDLWYQQRLVRASGGDSRPACGEKPPLSAGLSPVAVHLRGGQQDGQLGAESVVWRRDSDRRGLGSERSNPSSGKSPVRPSPDFISSLPGDHAEAVGRAVRAHWGIENGLHRCLDVTFREDDSRVRRRRAPTNFATVRRFAVNLIKRHLRQAHRQNRPHPHARRPERCVARQAVVRPPLIILEPCGAALPSLLLSSSQSRLCAGDISPITATLTTTIATTTGGPP